MIRADFCEGVGKEELLDTICRLNQRLTASIDVRLRCIHDPTLLPGGIPVWFFGEGRPPAWNPFGCLGTSSRLQVSGHSILRRRQAGTSRESSNSTAYRMPIDDRHSRTQHSTLNTQLAIFRHTIRQQQHHEANTLDPPALDRVCPPSTLDVPEDLGAHGLGLGARSRSAECGRIHGKVLRAVSGHGRMGPRGQCLFTPTRSSP